MAQVDNQVDKYRSDEAAARSATFGSLIQRIQQAIALPQATVRIRQRDTDLHILLEDQPCPDAEAVMRQQAAIADSLTQLPADVPVHRIILYGRSTYSPKVTWTRSIDPDRAHAAASGSPIANPSSWLQARQGETCAIGQYLSQVLREFKVTVRVRQETEPQAETQLAIARLPRLLIYCESVYSPDLLLLAEPITQRLRELELTGVRDAIVLGQVRGEPGIEWVLRVDLTPAEQILREWARWGDVQAIARLLSQALTPHHVQVTALLKESTLHLTCCAPDAPDQTGTIAAIAALLESLTPQGITAAALYGFSTVSQADLAQANTAQADTAQADTPDTPVWVHWLDLPSLTAQSTLALAQQGDLGAIAFLLTRLLNPALDPVLTTGGIRLQLRQKEDLLHIMTDAPTCPDQRSAGGAIVRFLRPLQISGIAGVRVYGRRAGQKQPLWSYGGDFVTRQRLVPEVTPEFAASDAYVGDLLAPAGALVLRSQTEADRFSLKRLLAEAGARVQRSLIATHLFAPIDAEAVSPSPMPSHYRGANVALVWSAIGLLLVVQSDWLLGRVPPAPTPAAAVPIPPVPTVSPVAALPKLSLQKQKTGDDVFSAIGFTRSTNERSTNDRLTNDRSRDISSADGVLLQASPLQPKAATVLMGQEQSYPPFNARQLDEKLALYRRFLRERGRPDVLIVGSSRALRGIDPVALQTHLAAQGYVGVKVFNLGINGATAQTVDLIVRQLLPQEALPKIIVFADGVRAFNSGRTDLTYSNLITSQGYQALLAGTPPIAGTIAALPSAPASKPDRYQAANQELDKRLGALSLSYGLRDRLKTLIRDRLAATLPKQQPDTTRAIALDKLGDTTSPAAAAADSPPTVLPNGLEPIDEAGFLPLPNRFNPATYYQKYARVPGDYDTDYEAFTLQGKQTKALMALAQFSQGHEMALVVVNMPMTRDYLDPTRKRCEEQFQQQMLQLSAQGGFVFQDLGQSVLQPDYFSDPSHLNRYGGYEISRRLAQNVMIPWSRSH